MDLFCPHCTRRVSITDDKAGQVTTCPLCAKQFMTPSLAPPPVAPRPAPPPPPPVSAPPVEQETYGMGPAPVPPPLPLPPPPPLPSMSAAPGKLEPKPAPPPPPVPPGDYSRTHVFELCGAWLAFVTPACLAAILVLSFFNWHYHEPNKAISLWGLSFTSDNGMGQFLTYTILILPTFVLAIAAMLFDKGWLFTPPQIAAVMMWKNLFVGLLLGMSFLCLCYDGLQENFLVVPRPNVTALAQKLAFRLHFVAMIASFSMFWLHLRKAKNLPLPKCEVRW